MDVKMSIFQFLGGLGLFLFSIKYMGDGLQMTAGDKLRYILDKYTTNPFLGVLTGVLVTLLIQSSSATTVITIGLVGASLLTLRQAIGIVMGANIGTTLTSFIIGFNISQYSLPIIFIGAALIFFTSKQFLNNIGRILYGFGGLFFALSLMSKAMKPLQHLDWFSDLMLKLADNSVLGVFVGTFLTVLIQSSSATIGILQNLYADGLITLQASLPVLFGDNIGTTITAILACLGASAVAKRVALSHVLFNVVGTIIFLIFLAPFTSFIAYLQVKLGLSPKLTIAFSHGIFNVVNTIIQFPFIGFIAYAVEKIIPVTKDEKVYKPEYLDELLIHSAPSVAIGNAKKEIEKMYEISIENFSNFDGFLKNKQELNYNKMELKMHEINKQSQDITKYITDIFNENLSNKESEVVSTLLDVTRDIDRVVDYSQFLSNSASKIDKKKITFSDNAKCDIIELMDTTKNMLDLSYEAFSKNDMQLAMQVEQEYEKMRAMEKTIRKKHVKRLQNSKCEIKSALHFVDCVSYFTRICELSKNVSEKVLQEQL